MDNQEQINSLLELLEQEEIQMKLFQIISDGLLGRRETREPVNSIADCENVKSIKKSSKLWKKKLVILGHF